MNLKTDLLPENQDREEKIPRKIKVLIAKTSLDGHWRGALLVASALKDAGMEVIYGGALTPEEIAETAIQEDVEVIGLNIGGRYDTVRALMDILGEKKVTDRLIIAGGTIPPQDIQLLKQIGIKEVFPPGSSLAAIISYINDEIAKNVTV